jgi:hypothetical protein
MTLNRRLAAAVAIAATLTTPLYLAACGGGGDTSSTPSAATRSEAAAATGGAGSSQAGGAASDPNATEGDFDPSNFGDPATGVNEWLPLKPGTQWVREGLVNVGSRRLPHRVVTTVTDVSKQIDGVRTAVVLDQDYNGGPLSEAALDYVAEDKLGNVWYLGSYTESYEGGQFVNASDAWLAGVNGATPGLLMLADPQEGAPPYSERAGPGLESTSSEVVATGQSQCVPFKCYKDVLVIEENGEEHKLYAPGVGQIKTEPITGGGKQEVEELVNLTRLSPRGLAEMSAQALKLDENASVQAPDVFGNASAAKRAL